MISIKTKIPATKFIIYNPTQYRIESIIYNIILEMEMCIKGL